MCYVFHCRLGAPSMVANQRVSPTHAGGGGTDKPRNDIKSEPGSPPGIGPGTMRHSMMGRMQRGGSALSPPTSVNMGMTSHHSNSSEGSSPKRSRLDWS